MRKLMNFVTIVCNFLQYSSISSKIKFLITLDLNFWLGLFLNGFSNLSRVRSRPNFFV